MSAYTPLTPNSNTAGSYITVANFLARCDQRTVGDLCSDTGTRVTPSNLTTDPNLAAALLDASGMFETAVMQGERYQPADIVTLMAIVPAVPGAGLINRLLTDLAVVLLYERRPDLGPMPEKLAWVEDYLARIAAGDLVFPFLQAQQAGLMTDHKETPTEVDARFLTTAEAGRLYGRRNNMNGRYPATGGFGTSGWPWGCY